MKKQFLVSILAAGAMTLTLATAAQAADAAKGQAAAKSLGCLKCHAPDKEVVGPSYKAVSAKFNKDSAKLIAAFEKVEDHGKVKKKSSKEDLENIAAWIFTL